MHSLYEERRSFVVFWTWLQQGAWGAVDRGYRRLKCHTPRTCAPLFRNRRLMRQRGEPQK